MTLEEALKLFKKASDVAGNYLEYVEIVSMHSINIVLSKIFNEHEAQLKAKAEEIERLKSELKHYKELASDLDDELREAQYELSDLRR